MLGPRRSYAKVQPALTLYCRAEYLVLKETEEPQKQIFLFFFHLPLSHLFLSLPLPQSKSWKSTPFLQGKLQKVEFLYPKASLPSPLKTPGGPAPDKIKENLSTQALMGMVSSQSISIRSCPFCRFTLSMKG